VDRLQMALERARKERDGALGNKPQAAPSLLAPLENTGTQRVNGSGAPTGPVPAPAVTEDGTFVGIRTVQTQPTLFIGGGLSTPEADRISSASYKMLRTRVLQKMIRHGWNTLAVCSATPNDGKTFTAVNLAIAIANDSKYTALLVDFDLRKPSIARRFGLELEYGVEDCLTGKVGLPAAMVAPAGYNKLVLLPARSAQTHSSELLTSERTVALIKEIKQRYSNRIVIFDLPPVLGADDALAFAPHVDCVLMVVGASHTRRHDLQRALEVLQNVPVLGTVLNGSTTENSSGYGYGYGY
jgi:protein-tyrosine kinase